MKNYLCNKREWFLYPKNVRGIKDWRAEIKDAVLELR